LRTLPLSVLNIFLLIILHFISLNSDIAKRTRVEKLRALFAQELESVSDPMTRRGLLQSIGLKEFSDYLALLPEERDTIEANTLLKQATENVKTATRQYARRQVSWIRNRFLRRPIEGSIPVYRIDVTDFLNSESPDIWHKTIIAPIVRLVYNELIKINDLLFENLKNNDYLKTESLLLPKSFIESNNNNNSPFICSICSNRIFTQIDGWEAHLKSRSHQKRAAKYKKRLLIEKAMKNLSS
ncbi:tRNA dimethylallyltransferase, partial [Schistosoma bovis]